MVDIAENIRNMRRASPKPHRSHGENRDGKSSTCHSSPPLPTYPKIADGNGAGYPAVSLGLKGTEHNTSQTNKRIWGMELQYQLERPEAMPNPITQRHWNTLSNQKYIGLVIKIHYQYKGRIHILETRIKEGLQLT